MYCIECGTEIPDNSKFCSSCGKSQTGQEPKINIGSAIKEIAEKEAVHQVQKRRKKPVDFIMFTRKIRGYYLAWGLFHFMLLLIFSSGIFNSGNSNEGIDDFWPFGGWSVCCPRDFANYYDITEFLVYTIFPVIILVIMGQIRSGKPSREQLANEKKSKDEINRKAKLYDDKL